MFKQYRIIGGMVVFVLVAILLSPVSAATVSWSGTLGSSLIASFAGDCGRTDGFERNYHVQLFYVDTTGNYDLTIISAAGMSFDSDSAMLSLYTPFFNSSDYTQNCIAHAFDAAGPASLTGVTLTAGSPYYVVVFNTWNSTFNGDATGATFNGQISGVGNICLGAPCSADTPITVEEDPAPQRVFFDERINDFDTGNSVVLYGKPDADDNWRLEVYNADETGLLLVVYPETIAAVPECPDSNTLIINDAATGISLWRLPQRTVTAEGVRICPFQLNAPSTEAGKTYVIIFDTLYPNTYYESEDEWIGQ